MRERGPLLAFSLALLELLMARRPTMNGPEDCPDSVDSTKAQALFCQPTSLNRDGLSGSCLYRRRGHSQSLARTCGISEAVQWKPKARSVGSSICHRTLCCDRWMKLADREMRRSRVHPVCGMIWYVDEEVRRRQVVK